MKSFDDLTQFAQTMLFDDEFSIWTQIYHLLYANTIFRTLRQIKVEAKELGLETALSNYFVVYMANTWYLTNATLGITRLCDNSKGVMSIPTMLKELRRFASRGLVDALTVRGWQQDYSTIPLENLKDYRDKYLAHQASAVSRQRLGSDWDIDVSLIDECEKRIVKLTHSMTKRLLDTTSMPLAQPALFAWDHSDSRLVPEALTQRVHEIWDKHEREMAEWIGITVKHPP